MRKMRKITAQIVCILLLLQTVFVPGLFTFSASAEAVAETNYSLSAYMKEIDDLLGYGDGGAGVMTGEHITSSPWSFQYRQITDSLPRLGMTTDLVSTAPWKQFTTTGWSESVGTAYDSAELPQKDASQNPCSFSSDSLTGRKLGNGLLEVGCFMLPILPNQTNHWMTVNPYNDGSISTEMGIAFTAPYSGTYTFLAGDDGTKDAWWQPVLGVNSNGNDVNVGYRITVNGKLVWNSDSGIDNNKAYREFSDEGHAIMPNGKTFELRAGDVFRVEFVSFDTTGYKWYRAIWSNFLMQLTTPKTDSYVAQYPIYDYTNAVRDCRGWVSGSDGEVCVYNLSAPYSSSPWRVTHKDGQNGNWQVVNPGVDADYKYVIREVDKMNYVTSNTTNSDSCPSFGFGELDMGAINVIAPWNDGANYHEMGYEFTTPATGDYHLGNASADVIQSVTECNYFRPLYDGHDFGLRVTLNGETVYEVASFNKNHPAVIPEMDMFLQYGDVVRIEIRALNSGTWGSSARVSGTFVMTRVKNSPYGDFSHMHRLGDYLKKLEAYRVTQNDVEVDANGNLNRVFAKPFVSDEPWSIQRRETEGVGWVPFEPYSSHDSGWDDIVHYVDENTNRSLDYPCLAYFKPTGESLTSDYTAMIAPTYTQPTAEKKVKHDMAYVFTAGATGQFGFGPSAVDPQFKLYDATATQNYGVRITINNIAYWPSTTTSGITYRNGYAVISQGNPVDIPLLKNIHMKKGDVLRVEFTRFDTGGELYHARITGTVEVALMEESAEDDNTARTFGLYEYFADVYQSYHEGTAISSTSPWSVQSKVMTKASGASDYLLTQNWYKIGKNVVRDRYANQDGSYTSTNDYYVHDNAAGTIYPGFNFNYPSDVANSPPYKNAAVSPVRTNSNGTETRTDVAYAFTAPVDGEYQLTPTDAALWNTAILPAGYFARRDDWQEGGKIVECGMRITVNERVIWNGHGKDTPDAEGYVHFTQQGDKMLAIPTLQSIGLKKGDVLRIEFTNFGTGPYYQTRIYGLADVSLKEPDTDNKYYLEDYSYSLARNYSKNGTDANTAATHNTMLVASSGSPWHSAWYGLNSTANEYVNTKYSGATKSWNAFTYLHTDGWAIYASKDKNVKTPAMSGEAAFVRLRPAPDVPVAHVFTAPKSGCYTFKANDVNTSDSNGPNSQNRLINFVAEGSALDVRIVKNGVTLWPTDSEWCHLDNGAATPIPTLSNIAMEKGDVLRIETRCESGTPTLWSSPMMQYEGTATVGATTLLNFDGLMSTYVDKNASPIKGTQIWAQSGKAWFLRIPANRDIRFSLYGARNVAGESEVQIQFGPFTAVLCDSTGAYKIVDTAGKNSINIPYTAPYMGNDGRYDIAINYATISTGGYRYTFTLNGESHTFDSTTAGSNLLIHNQGNTALTLKNGPTTIAQKQADTVEGLGLGINMDADDRTVLTYPQSKFWTVKESDKGSALAMFDRGLNRYVRVFETQSSPCGTGLFDDITLSTDMYIGDLERTNGNWWYGGEIVVRDELQIGFHRYNVNLYAGAAEHGNAFPYSALNVQTALGYTHDEWENDWHNIRVTHLDGGFIVFLDGREIYYYDGVEYRVNGVKQSQVPAFEKYGSKNVGAIYLRSESGNAMFANTSLIADVTPHTTIQQQYKNGGDATSNAGLDTYYHVYEKAIDGSGASYPNLFTWANANWKIEYRNTASNMQWTASKMAEFNKVRFYPQETTADQVQGDGGLWENHVLWPMVEYGWLGEENGGGGLYIHARKTTSADENERAAATFTAPALATYRITCPYITSYHTTNYMVVTLNGKQIWPENGEPYVGASGSEKRDFGEIVTKLDKNDVVRFECWSDGNNASAGMALSPKIEVVEDIPYEYYGTSVSLIQPYGQDVDASLGLNVYYSVKGNADTALYYCDFNGQKSGTLAAMPAMQDEDGTITYKYQLPLTATRMGEKFKFYFMRDGKRLAIMTTSIEEYAYKILEEDSSWGYWSTNELYDENLVNDPYDTRTYKTGEHEDGMYPVSLKATLAAMLEYGRIAQVYHKVNSTCVHPGYGVCQGDLNPEEHIGDYPTDRLEEFIGYDQEKLHRVYHTSLVDLRNKLNVWSVGNNQFNAAKSESEGYRNVQVTPDTKKGSDGRDVYLYGTSLVLDSTVSLKVYFQGTWQGNEHAVVKLKSGDLTVSYQCTGQLVTYSGNIKSLTISGLSVTDLDEVFTIQIIGSGQKSNTIEVSALGYVSRVLDTYDGGVGGHGVSNNLRDLLLRLTDFHLQAKRYFEVWKKISDYDARKAAAAQ